MTPMSMLGKVSLDKPAARQRIDTKYDFRYSQLPLVLGTLLREKRIEAEDLTGLSDAKRRCVRAVASLGEKGNAG
ncbi:MAG TPA: hypothetical protein DIT03_09715 [Candidatus Accumulibacter sp.]|nr:hypothetical protein [Accumulibacter sp.]